MFGRRAASALEAGERLPEFGYVSRTDHYLDAACQSMRPQPVLDAMTAYFTRSNACGGRVRYEWGRKVDEEAGEARRAALRLLGLSDRDHAVSFTLNTTYGINLLAQQVTGFARVVTTDKEHNAVVLPSMTVARGLGVPRIVLERDDSGAVAFESSQLERALVLVGAVSNVDGERLANLGELVRRAHAVGGAVIVDAAQAMGHDRDLLTGIGADAICFSSHKMYGPSLGVIVARRDFLRGLDLRFVGGGMVSGVTEDGFELVAGDEGAWLEPGLQAWAEIQGFRAAADWLGSVRPGGLAAAEHLDALAARLFDGLRSIAGLTVVNRSATPIISCYADSVDAHRLAQYASSAGVMVRSGYFCAHDYLQNRRALPPLLRFSLGLHSTAEDVDAGIGVLSKLVRGLR